MKKKYDEEFCHQKKRETIFKKSCLHFRSTGICPTSTCCRGLNCGTCPTKSSSWARAAPSPVWTRRQQHYTSTAAAANGRWATRAGSAISEKIQPNLQFSQKIESTLRAPLCFKCYLNSALAFRCLSSRCHQCASVCAVCHHVVKGLFVWCQGCSHGGHLEHIMNWLKISAHCPAGCGHLCEYTWHNRWSSSVAVGMGPLHAPQMPSSLCEGSSLWSLKGGVVGPVHADVYE